MQIFISGTDTNIGKTIICSWLCVHTGYSYFKPIQTGTSQGSDSGLVHELSGANIHSEQFLYKDPVSPHLASKLVNEKIDLTKIILPQATNLIVEGAGGVLVPVNENYLMVDLIKQLKIPVIIVTSSRLGTINHTLLTIESLNKRNIKLLGVIINGIYNQDNTHAIEFYGNTKVLAQIPWLDNINRNSLKNIPLTTELKTILIGKNQ